MNLWQECVHDKKMMHNSGNINYFLDVVLQVLYGFTVNSLNRTS